MLVQNGVLGDTPTFDFDLHETQAKQPSNELVMRIFLHLISTGARGRLNSTISQSPLNIGLSKTGAHRVTASKNLASLSLIAALASCGTSGIAPASPADPAANASNYLLTVSTTPCDSAAGLERRYQGTITIFRPEAGFAVLGVNTAPAQNDPRVLGLDANDTPIALPEVRVTSDAPQLLPQEDTWSEGVGAWSGGVGAWSGGWGQWSDGLGSSLSPTENAAIWAQIHLPQAQQLATNAGAGVTVAVIDTGIDLSHPAFQGHLTPG
jgi:subtilisin family serine protease